MIWNYREHHKSKSGAELEVVIQMSREQLREFTEKNSGFRVYRLHGIPRGAEGGKEFHRVKKEIVIVDRGEIELELEHLNGGKERHTLKENDIFFLIKPLTFHTYRGLAESSTITVLASSVYRKGEPETHDSYSEGDFRKLQKESG